MRPDQTRPSEVDRERTFATYRLTPSRSKSTITTMSRLFILLLIVNILTCPLRCISCEANAATGNDVARATCSCCHAEACPADFATPKTPVPCEDDCDCHNCFCDGAVVENGPGLLVAAFQMTQWLSFSVVLNQAGVSSIVLTGQNPIPLHGWFACGRDARIGLQSLLI